MALNHLGTDDPPPLARVALRAYLRLPPDRAGTSGATVASTATLLSPSWSARSPAAPSPRSPTRGRQRPVGPDEHRLGHEGDAEGVLHTPGDLAREGDELRCRPRPAVGERERVLARDRDALGVAVPTAKPARSMSQAADVLTCPSASGHAGGGASGPRRSAARALRAANASASSTGLVKNEPAETVSASSGSRTMPLPRRSASTASRTSASGPRADLDAQGAGELGIADRRRALRGLQGEAHREDHPAPRLALERARAVGEAAVGRGERATAPSARSSTRTAVIVSATSWP